MYTIQSSTVYTPEDILQEMELFKLERGIAPNRKFIENRLMRRLGGVSISYEDIDDIDHLDIAFIVEATGLTEDELDKLLDWAEAHDVVDLTDVILGLDEGDPEVALAELLDKLQISIPKMSKTTSSISTLIFEILDEAPTSLDLLIEKLTPTIQRIFSNRRPEAAIRQAVRRLLRKGDVIVDANGFYSHKETQ